MSGGESGPSVRGRCPPTLPSTPAQPPVEYQNYALETRAGNSGLLDAERGHNPEAADAQMAAYSVLLMIASIPSGPHLPHGYGKTRRPPQMRH